MLKRGRGAVRGLAGVILVLAAVFGIAPAVPSGAQAAGPPRVLFIRGARDTVGAGDTADAVDNNQLSDIADLVGNAKAGKGYGVYAQLLAAHGYEVSQLEESGTRATADPVNLTQANLSQYKVVVFGSNNSGYTADDVKAVTDYVAAGGSALFMADRNWGPVTGRASTSDDLFLKQWGIALQQDNGQTEGHTTADYLVADHPILAGVNSFSSLGVSACTVGIPPANAGLTKPATVLVPFTTTVHQNDKLDADGTERPPTAADGALVVLQPGRGRVACFYDRDPFFNFSINDPDQSHATLGLNLINWLAAR
jgi:hypothetical protein